jgi:pimeloyl-ACP methyl ester carboxylesterase
LVVAGDDDPFIPISVSRTLVGAIPDARLELITGSGHLIPTNQPVRFASLVRRFLG